MKTVEFYYDLVSPYSYLAHREVSRICDEHGAELSLRPMLLGAVHNAVGLQAPIETEAKARYQAEDIRRWAEHYGLPIDFPDPFPFRTLKSMRAAMFLEDRGELEAFTREAFDLYWEEGGAPKGLQESDEDGPVSEAVRRIGADPDEVLAGASAPGAKEALKTATGEAVERGVFGAPAFFVGDEMFWGNDRLHFVEAALGRS
ncbi:MAG: 2-hydroxychromene-2-carboxylate isomerase family protein [uncultured Rubrobacteraceae bacterium]|uniref:2-hydroxychromene-2-carboxylate isomerase n=1 Tax=uncultured Rubrobacteraceae bacterium TaxID=349277 RepID=A0A6J4PW18_9ACTN|nr:MAG: 2-hydroxychromene-2-carboxylate isomerase family protein [uncultured Rubrobacteraceae bacterium]